MMGSTVLDQESVVALPTFEDLLVLAREDLYVFLELTFETLHPGQKLIPAQYLDLMASVLMSVEEGGERRVIINMPPRAMKSMLVSVMYVAWRLGRDPTAKFICISYGDDLAHDLSGMTRKLMLSDIYRRIFPGTVLEKKAVDHITTTKGGRRYATAVGSDITGFGADEIIIDDPIEPNDSASELAKEKVRAWVGSSVLTRFNNPKKGALILVMHRLAPDDLSATLEATGQYYTLKLPLVAEQREEFECESGRTLLLRNPGDILYPGRLNKTGLEELKASLPAHVFASQYQQRPTAGGSGMLSIERLQRYDRTKAPAFEAIIHSWDVGGTVTGNASVCTKWGVARDPKLGDLVYLTELVRLKAQLPDVRSAIKAHDKLDLPALIIVDERGLGLGLYQELRQEGYAHVQVSSQTSAPLALGGSEVGPNVSKVDRFGRAAFVIANGRVFIPTEAPWLESFLYEFASFPNIQDDDQVDSMTQLLANLDRALRLARSDLRSRSQLAF